MRVDLLEEDGTAHTVYEGGDKTECGGWLRVAFPLTSYAARKVKVVTRYQGGEGIDTVALETPPAENYQYNGFNQLVSVTPTAGAPTTFAYDGNGNQVAKTDALGTTTYTYNLDNRLVGITAPAGSSAYEYDANGLRTKKTDSAGTRSYLLDGLSVVAEYAPDATKLAWYTQSLARIDEVLNVVNDQGKYWYETDALGSTYAMTNASGAVVSRSSYDVFGERSLASLNDVEQPFGFTGREHDPGSGLVYARDRYLSPAAGRWTQADRLGLAAGPNFFAYANNQSTRFADPTGQVVPAMVVLAGIGAVYGAVFSFIGGLVSGLKGVQLLQHVGIGMAAGIAAMLLPASGVAALAVINGVMAAIGSLAQSIARSGWGNLGLEDFIGAAISGAIAGAITLLVGFGVRSGVSPVFEEFFTHLSAGDAAIAGISATAAPAGALSDFLVQTLVIPAMRQVKQRMQIEAMFRDNYDEVLGLCR
jgi:RHS repeat-associated protein